MRPKDHRRLATVWIVVIAITGACWLESTRPPSTLLQGLLIALTMTKAWLVIWHFMELREAPRWLQTLAAGWVGVVFVVLTATYLR